MNYLIDLGFTTEEVGNLEIKFNLELKDMLSSFPKIVAVNYNTLKTIGIGNIKEVFENHTKMFLQNPDKFNAIFSKYDQADLIRCIEKNAAVVEKL